MSTSNVVLEWVLDQLSNAEEIGVSVEELSQSKWSLAVGLIVAIWAVLAFAYLGGWAFGASRGGDIKITLAIEAAFLALIALVGVRIWVDLVVEGIFLPTVLILAVIIYNRFFTNDGFSVYTEMLIVILFTLFSWLLPVVWQLWGWANWRNWQAWASGSPFGSGTYAFEDWSRGLLTGINELVNQFST